MNFHDFIDNERQRLVNDINTIGNSLTSIFNLRNESKYSEKFYGKIHGLSHVRAEIIDQKIQFTVRGVDKFEIGMDEKKTLENIKNNVLPKLSTKQVSYSIGGHNNLTIVISFERLTTETVKDIMFLMNNSPAELRPSSNKMFDR
jgi:hypothetical protein